MPLPKLLTALLVVAALVGVRASAARAFQSVTLNVTVDRTQVTVGDRIAVTVVLRLPAGAQPDFTGLEQQFDELDVVVIGLPVRQALPGGIEEFRIRYEVAAFQLGSTQVPSLTIGFTGPDGAAATATSAPIPITVVSVIPPGADAAEVRDLKPQIDLLFSTGISRRAIMAVVAFVVATIGLAGLAGWWLWRPRPAPALPAPAAPAPSPEAAARAELDRIAGLGLLEKGDAVTFHALLAACVRRYLSEHYGFPAFAMTTAELRTRMEQHGVGRWQARLAAGLLSECDSVAYARYAPARARSESNLSMAYEIVSLTDEAAASPAALTV